MVQVQEHVEVVTEEKQEIAELSDFDLQWIGGGLALGDGTY